MPSSLLERPAQAIPLAPPRKTWTRDECAVLVSSGLLTGSDFELVDAELIQRTGIERPHSWVAHELRFWLALAFGARRVCSATSIVQCWHAS